MNDLLAKHDITKRVFKAHDIGFETPTFKAFWMQDYSIIAIQDTCTTEAELLGDMFNPEANPDIPHIQLKREEKAYKARIRKEGVWGVGLAVRGAPLWETIIWGFVGDDFIESGYDLDLIKTLSEKGAKNAA